MGCLGVQNISSQAALDVFLTNCTGSGGIIGGEQIQVDGPLNIQNFTDAALWLNTTFATISISNGITIVGGEDLTSIHMESSAVTLVDGSYGAADDKPHGLLIQDLPNLTFMNVSAVGAISNLTLRDLPKLTSMSPTTFHIDEGGTVDIENTGLSGQSVSLGCDESSGFTCGQEGGLFGGGDDGGGSDNLTLSHIIVQNNSGSIALSSSAVTNVIDSIIMTGGSKNSLSFSTLATADFISMTNIAKLSLPKLHVLGTGMTMESSSLASLDAPALASISSGNFTVNRLAGLTSVNVPALKTINGSLQLTSNPKLKQVSQMGLLETVSGGINITGSFDTVVLPSLHKVRGGMELQSTGNFSCSTVNFATIAGKDYTCVDKTTASSTNSDIQSISSTNTSTKSSPSSHRHNSKLLAGVIAGIVIGILVVVTLIAVGFGLLWRRRRKPKAPNESSRSSTFYGRVEMDQGEGHVSTMAEMNGHGIGPRELGGKFDYVPPQELAGTSLANKELQEVDGGQQTSVKS